MASTYLSRTCGSTASSYTVSMWVRTSRTSGTSTSALWWNAGTNKLNWELNSNGQIYIYTPETRTTGYYRDVGAWYHLVWSVNSNVGTLYVNGVAESGLTDVSSIASLNSSNDIQIGGDNGGSTFDGSMTHVHFIDGTAYTASDFGETDSTTGIWKPKTAPSVTYGSNGFFLKMENSGSMGTDSSGNSNNLTVNGTMTQTIDTPSNVFATLNPLNSTGNGTEPTYSIGNLQSVSPSSGGGFVGSSTLGVSSGKYYFEVQRSAGTSTNVYIGIGDETSTREIARQSASAIYAGNQVFYKPDDGNKVIVTNGSGVESSYGDTYGNGDIIGIALNMDDNEVTFYKNGTAQDSGTAISIPTPDGACFLNIINGADTSDTFQVNFGNGYFGTTAVSSAQNPDDGIGIFEYDVPTGYRALCTKSINAEGV